MIHNFVSKQFIIFLLSGGIAALCNFFSRIVYSYFMSFSLAVIFAYINGMIVAFLLSKKFVFTGSKQKLKYSIFFFIVVNFIAVIQTWFFSMLFAYKIFPWIGLKYYPFEFAHAIGIAIPVFTSFIGHKYWSFKSS